jgi:Na+/H+ antiporter NhaC
LRALEYVFVRFFGALVCIKGLLLRFLKGHVILLSVIFLLCGVILFLGCENDQLRK